MPTPTHFVDGPVITALRSERAVWRLLLVLAALFLVLPGGGEAAESKAAESKAVESEGHDISGRWLHDGTPKAGGVIQYKGEGMNLRGTVTTDAAGRFTIRDMEPGWYVLQVDLLGDEGLDRERGLHSVRGGFVRHRLVLGWQDAKADLKTWSTTLSGTVRDAEGKPVSVAKVRLERPGPTPNYWSAGEMQRMDLSDADGYFEFRGVPPGRWCLVADAEKSAPTLVWIEVPDVEADVRQDLVLGDPSSLAFRVVGPEGEIPKNVYATLTDHNNRIVARAMLWPDDLGRVILNDAPAGTWRLWFRGGLTDTRSFDVEVPGRHEHPWKLAPTGRIRLSGHEQPRVLEVSLFKEDGTQYRQAGGSLPDTMRPYRSTIRAPLGEWTMHVEGPDGYRWRGKVVVSPDVDNVVELPSAKP